MEFVLITYAHDRDVLVDGVVAGLTNHLIALAPGTYTFSLDGPRDFSPLAYTIAVENTAPQEPLELTFV